MGIRGSTPMPSTSQALTDVPEQWLSREQRRVRHIIREHGSPMNLLELAAVGKNYKAMSMMASRMVRDGLLVRVKRGAYGLPPEPSRK